MLIDFSVAIWTASFTLGDGQILSTVSISFADAIRRGRVCVGYAPDSTFA